MAISETTKRIAVQQRRALQSAIDRNLRDIEDAQQRIAILEEANVPLQAQIAALKKDIPEPTIVEEPV